MSSKPKPSHRAVLGSTGVTKTSTTGSGTLGKARLEQAITLRAAGCTVTEIAARLQVSTGVVSRSLQQTVAREAIDQAQADARRMAVQDLHAASTAAIHVLRQIMEGEPDAKGDIPTAQVRRQAANDLLNRAGLTADQLVYESTVRVRAADLAHLSPEQLAALAWGDPNNPNYDDDDEDS